MGVLKYASRISSNGSPIIAAGRQAIIIFIQRFQVARDSGVCVVARNDGTVKVVSSDCIDVVNDDGSKETYHLTKFMRSNQSNCYNQRPIVNAGDHITKGEIIADGPSTSNGEIALGKNPLIGFMTWEGYNYEDAVLLSERLVHIMLLSSKDALIKSVMISKGTVCNSAVSPREVFKTALKHNAAGIILVHNHPSGDPTPSADDIHLMQNIRQLGIIMNIPLKDSVIIGDNRYMSFLEEDLF